MPLTYNNYALVENMFDALTWVAIIVAAYLVLDAVNNDDDDPECPA